MENNLSDDDIKKIAFAIADVIKKHFENERPMGRVEAAAFIGYGQRTFDRMVAAGKFKAHRIEEGAHPHFFASELIECIKKC